ncbi:MmcQ/YjbR family DNA-binding protein [Aeromonas caviae]|mgnify:FL=1|jgi:predicted DNA-binding protein (MmcQ/YjbR family)|uniref:MmcQ/YjbR family DNA-binding protein n=1 Tax=Aeromonas TaxID=642 RepID=UPI000CD082D7|nr:MULTISPECIES: MmcQ/YjbR family DNA-binding protein [Aeromonas]AUT41126.1 MmcQ-like protein [Aeromonas sp. ASNIH5]MBL0576412.1 MmcQ/YjbR family DNA-binding protein [Aeromonas caviae]MCX4037118.1 MmcQ/YjbR family DNA-binding protein [Aeromonas caviae]MDH0239664.1 MmcQ/YjbR family DNA-binding protein [Aeromonas caviae]MDH0351805.1 MmcQ/YjbR family DNA-binding protein [Aeromonas caviae]
MTLVQLREFLLSQPGATEDTPFGPEILVYRIAGKMFALVDWQAEPLSINLKCEPELALLLREIHPEVKPGWHMNKQHWNTVTLSEGLSDDLWQGWIVHSYERVVAGLPRAKRPQAPRSTIREG